MKIYGPQMQSFTRQLTGTLLRAETCQPGERVTTNRRDVMKLARLFRAGELTEI